MQHAIHWFEIPVADLARATAFYERMTGRKLERSEMSTADMEMMMFPYAFPGVGGCLVRCAQIKPGADGPCVYLDGGEDLAVMLARVEAAGGKVVVPKTLITPEIGYFAILIDSEGNRIGLHSMK